jgi:hypothetical protein
MQQNLPEIAQEQLLALPTPKVAPEVSTSSQQTRKASLAFLEAN